MFPSIVMLHHVSDSPAYKSLKPYSITTKTFIRLLDFIERSNYQTITFNDIVSEEKNLLFSKNKIILTFDDCSKSLFDFAIPELIKRNLNAVFYIPTAHIGSYNSWDIETGKKGIEIMNEKDLRELIKFKMEIGSHSHHHIKLKNLDRAEVEKEVTISKKIIENITGKKIYSFAYPYGSVPKQYKQILKAAGYLYATAIYYPFQNNFALRRFIYHDGDTEKTLSLKISKLYHLYRCFRDLLHSIIY